MNKFYYWWNCLIHGFTAFFIDYLFIGVFSYGESSFSSEVMNNNIYLQSFSIILVIIIFLFLFFLIVLLVKLFIWLETFDLLKYIIDLNELNKVKHAVIILLFIFLFIVVLYYLCCYLRFVWWVFSFLIISCIYWLYKKHSNYLYYVLRNVGNAFDSSSTYSITFFKLLFLVWNSFFWTKGFIVLIEYWAGMYLAGHKLNHLLYANSFQFGFILIFMISLLIF